jgi:uncharacterized protein with PQ loop repeat
MSFSVSLNLIDSLGYTGGSMVAFNSIPTIISVLKDNVDVSMPEEKINVAVLFMNVIGGSLLIAYGVLLDLMPIYITFSVIVLANIIGIFVKIGLCISKNRNEILY